MTLFVGYPQYPRFRVLRGYDRRADWLVGEDVFAIQTAIDALARPLTCDGILGPTTAEAIRLLQAELGIEADGKGGPATKLAVCRKLTKISTNRHGVPHMLSFGQVVFECGGDTGNYSAQRPNGSYDAGATQRNTEHVPAVEGFNVPDSIEKLATDTRAFHDEFAGVKDEARRWALAAGGWNAPAYARWIAKSEGATRVRTRDTSKPGPTARATIEAYMRHATALVA